MVERGSAGNVGRISFWRVYGGHQRLVSRASFWLQATRRQRPTKANRVSRPARPLGWNRGPAPGGLSAQTSTGEHRPRAHWPTPASLLQARGDHDAQKRTALTSKACVATSDTSNGVMTCRRGLEALATRRSRSGSRSRSRGGRTRIAGGPASSPPRGQQISKNQGTNSAGHRGEKRLRAKKKQKEDGGARSVERQSDHSQQSLKRSKRKKTKAAPRTIGRPRPLSRHPWQANLAATAKEQLGEEQTEVEVSCNGRQASKQASKRAVETRWSGWREGSW